VIDAAAHSNPAFDWEAWYAAAGGRREPIPEVSALLTAIYEGQYPRFEGELAPERIDLGDPILASAEIKEQARRLGADIVGIARVEPSDLYRGRSSPHPLAIVLGKAMRYSEFRVVPSRESAIECVRIYHALGEICIALAAWLRARGHACVIEHPIGDSSVQHVPLAIRAGFGELGRHGSIIHPTFGPLFRIGSVLTSVDLALDTPLDAGIGAFCDTCRACRIYCPADAIPDTRDPSAGKDPQGNDRYVIDTGRCFGYFAEHKYCSACLPTCVYAHKLWAKDEDGKTLPFPDVRFEEAMPPVDSIARAQRHEYPQLARDGFVPEWRVRARARRPR
jgi:ferredoxin